MSTLPLVSLFLVQSGQIDGVWSSSSKYPIASTMVARDSCLALPFEVGGQKFSRFQAKIRVEDGEIIGIVPSSNPTNGPRYVLGFRPRTKSLLLYELPWQGTFWKEIQINTLQMKRDILVDVRLIQVSNTKSSLKVTVDYGTEQTIELPQTLSAFEDPAAFAYNSKGSLPSFIAYYKRSLEDRSELGNPYVPSKSPSYVPLGSQLEYDERYAAFAVAVRNELEKYRAQYKIPGAACAIVVDDKIVCLATTGVRKNGDAVPLTINDRFHLGSNTKSMTATLLGRYVDSGLIKFSDTLATLLPDLAPIMHVDCKKITLFNLLHGSSGISGDGYYPDYEGKSLTALRTETIKKVLSRATSFSQGSRFDYQSMNFIIAGGIIDRLSSEPWEQSIQKRLFLPIDASSVGYGPMGLPGTFLGPYGHTYQNGMYVPSWGDNQA